VAELAPSPDYVLVDGTFPLPDLALAGNPAQRAVPHGDRLSLTVGAASIVAKVVRDRWMQRYDRLYPAYGFGAHKGYATAAHLAALRLHGPCPIHRKTFAPVRLCSFV
jgi:ribonuclease HII